MSLCDGWPSDDMAVLAELIGMLPLALEQFHVEAAKLGLPSAPSVVEDKVQNLGTGHQEPDVVISGNTTSLMKDWEEFRYLGYIQSSFRTCYEDAYRRIEVASSAMQAMRLAWSESRLSLDTKLRLSGLYLTDNAVWLRDMGIASRQT